MIAYCAETGLEARSSLRAFCGWTAISAAILRELRNIDFGGADGGEQHGHRGLRDIVGDEASRRADFEATAAAAGHEAARRCAGRNRGDCRQLILAADPPAQVDLRIYASITVPSKGADDQ